MSIRLTITQDDRSATINVINDGAALSNPTFDFITELRLTGVDFDDVNTILPGSLSLEASTTNDGVSVAFGGAVIGTLAAGAVLATIDLSVNDAGRVVIDSFGGALAGSDVTPANLPSASLSAPSPATGDFVVGDLSVGSTLSVNTNELPGWDVFFSEFDASYQWLRDGVPISRATGEVYQLRAADAGAVISATVTYTDMDSQEQMLTDSTDGQVGASTPSDGGTAGDDRLIGDNADETIAALGGDDTVQGGGGNDTIDGGNGVDVALYSGDFESYTLTLGGAGLIVEDRRGNGDGIDVLSNVEQVGFDGLTVDPFDLEIFGGTASLSASAMESFVELYIAYFNRAPDAVGLNFWGTAFANGTTFEEMAALFSDQDETRATYDAGLSNAGFATAVYDNVLGRVADAAGFEFWTGVLDSGERSRDQFIRSVLEGAKTPIENATLDQRIQQIADQQYLSIKTDIGAYFSVTKGLSNVADASAVMSLFNGSASSITDARDAIDVLHTAALDGDNGSFLLPLVGVLDDPFAGIA